MMEDEEEILRDTIISPIGEVLAEKGSLDDSTENGPDHGRNGADDVPGDGVEGVWDPFYIPDGGDDRNDDENDEEPVINDQEGGQKPSKKDQRKAELQSIEDFWKSFTAEPLAQLEDPMV